MSALLLCKPMQAIARDAWIAHAERSAPFTAFSPDAAVAIVSATICSAHPPWSARQPTHRTLGSRGSAVRWYDAASTGGHSSTKKPPSAKHFN